MKIKIELDVEVSINGLTEIDNTAFLTSDSHDNVCFELPGGIKFTTSGQKLIRAVKILQSVSDYCDV